MARRRAPVRPRKSDRRWHIPPPLVHGPEPLEGGAVLEENRDAAGVVLWQALRDVLLWVETPAEQRGEIFAAEAGARWRRTVDGVGLEPELAAPLRALSELVDSPAAVTGESVAGACREIAQWAQARNSTATALAFLQNAALATPADAMPALAVARLAAGMADYARAEVWYRRAVGLARQARDWRTYSQAFSGLGELHRSRGALPSAHRFHIRALRGARRGGLRVEQAVALHDLFNLSVEAGRTEEAERYARHAFEAYGARNQRVALLARDVAYFWMQRGHFRRALAVLQAVLPLIDWPLERLFGDADLMRAAAGAGDSALARQMVDTVLARSDRPEYAASAGRALLEIGRGALQLQDPELAELAAERALRLATERREGRTRLTAESLLEAAPTQSDQGADGLAEELIRTLRGLSPAAD